MFTDMPAFTKLGAGLRMLANAVISLTTAPSVIDFESSVKVSYTVEVLARMWAGAIIGDPPRVGAEVYANGSAFITTALEFELPTRLYELLLSCLAPFSC